MLIYVKVNHLSDFELTKDTPYLTSPGSHTVPTDSALRKAIKTCNFGARSWYLRHGLLIACHRILRILWDAISYPCLNYLLLAPKSSYQEPIVWKLNEFQRNLVQLVYTSQKTHPISPNISAMEHLVHWFMLTILHVLTCTNWSMSSWW